MKTAFALAMSLYASTSFADMVVPMNLVDEKGVASSAGEVTVTESEYGLVFTPQPMALLPSRYLHPAWKWMTCQAAR